MTREDALATPWGRDVAGLDRFEQFFERIVEGTIMRFFRSPIQPAEIGHKLERAMEDGRIAGVGAPLVPNEYRVEMHPRDMIAFADFVLPLSRQIEGWLAEEIADRGYQTLGRVMVQIGANERVARPHDRGQGDDQPGDAPLETGQRPDPADGTLPRHARTRRADPADVAPAR